MLQSEKSRIAEGDVALWCEPWRQIAWPRALLPNMSRFPGSQATVQGDALEESGHRFREIEYEYSNAAIERIVWT